LHAPAGAIVTSALLIFPHQLFEAGFELAAGKRVWLIEEPLFFDQYPFHRQKLVLHRASMKLYERALQTRGHATRYVDCAEAHDLRAVLQVLRAQGVREVHIIDPADDWLQQRIDDAAARTAVQCVMHETPMFLSPRRFIQETLGEREHLSMAAFYARQRKRMDILMDDGRPRGGRFSFDAANRKPLPRNLQPPPLPSAPVGADIDAARAYVAERYPRNPGDDGLLYPVTHAGARDWLRHFLEFRLFCFGDYQDAISSRHRTLYHSVLSPMLNIGLLTPDQVVRETLQYAGVNRVPLNALEGFIRQIIGWREYVHGAYRLLGRRSRTRNFWGHRRKLSERFWRGRTGIVPLDTMIQGVLEHAYAHHIERLMLAANFMLLCEFDPDEVYRWFMSLFIDAYDWVMVPNVYSMGLYADGGLITTKPYVCGANYIVKMSDFRRGRWSEIWDALFWRFLHRHRRFFSNNARLRMLVRRVEALPADTLSRYISTAEGYLAEA
jgi:deoxyribodipyrimidine photolyase-related protein